MSFAMRSPGIVAMTPVVDVEADNTITVGSTTYVEGEDFFLVNDISREGGRSRAEEV